MNENIRLVPLNGGLHAIVDTEDFALVSAYKWILDKDGYAVTKLECGKRMLMHRMIMQAPPKSLVDHANQNRIDNRRANLRFCSKSQNAANSKMRATNKTGFRGVHQSLSNPSMFGATITIDNKHFFLGYSPDVEKAAKAYDAAARYHYGDFAQTNFSGDEALSVDQVRRMLYRDIAARSGFSSSYRGVKRFGSTSRWAASIQHKKKSYHLGLFDSEIDAAKAYDLAAISLGVPAYRRNFEAMP